MISLTNIDYPRRSTPRSRHLGTSSAYRVPHDCRRLHRNRRISGSSDPTVRADPLLNLAFTPEYLAANQGIGSKFMPWSPGDGEDLAVFRMLIGVTLTPLPASGPQLKLFYGWLSSGSGRRSWS